MNKDEALKMAIEALDEYPVSTGKLRIALEACKEALEQPAQEPVLYIDQSGLDGHATWAQPNACQDTDIALYTHPHQWQGLTDDEIEVIDRKFENTEAQTLEFARAIEQALKEKNT